MLMLFGTKIYISIKYFIFLNFILVAQKNNIATTAYNENEK